MSNTKVIEVPQPDFREVRVTIQGVTPLLCNRWSEEDIEGIRGKQEGKGKIGKAPRDPDKIAHDSLHSMNSGGPPYGFPCSGIQKAMAMAGYRFAGYTTTEINGSLNVIGDLLEITGSKPHRDSRPAKIPGRNSVWTIAHRGCFEEWSIEVPIRYNASVITLEQVLNLLNLAGFAVGIGCYRPESKGTFGQFVMGEVKEEEVVGNAG